MNSLKMKLPLILLIFIISLITINAQSKICYTCNKEIEANYLVVDDKNYHRHCFLCEFCGKQIAEGYEKHEEKYYHTNCYTEKFVSKCDVCAKPLTGKFFVDAFDKKYHIQHENELKKCDNCTRLICQRITKGSVKYGDGRVICNICYRNSANGQFQYDNLLDIVIKSLGKMGLNIDSENITIKATDRKGLKKAAGSDYSDMLKGYNNTNIRVTNGNEKIKHTIYVLTLIPSEHIQSVVAHELMHIWLHQNTANNHEMALKEGSCNYVSYVYMKTLTSREAISITRLYGRNVDPIYGDGFRKVKDKFGSSNLDKLQDFLKNNDDF